MGCLKFEDNFSIIEEFESIRQMEVKNVFVFLLLRFCIGVCDIWSWDKKIRFNFICLKFMMFVSVI